MTDYSQFGEQACILEIFKNYDPATSRFLDIGAYDGKSFSNTWALVERGWGGLYVEPGAYAFDALLDNVSTLPEEQQKRIILVNAAIGINPGLKKFWYSKDQLATSEDQSHEKWRAQVKFHPQQCYVAFITLEQLFYQFCGPFHFINIDTEGTSPELFMQLPLADLQPKAICLEYEDKLVNVWNLAKSLDYRQILLNGVNTIFAL